MRTLCSICFALCFCSLLASAKDPATLQSAGTNPQVDYPGFVALTDEVQAFRKNRLVPIEKFNRMSRERGTIILDTRSKAAFEALHVKGAIHLNFSDFTADKLAKVIPTKNARILVYCNNNFVAERIPEIAMKRAPLALNIPTFVNLYGYGYKNVYELADNLALGDKRIRFAGTRVESIAELAAKQSR